MDYQQAAQQGANTVVTGVRHFDLEAILECGQCFRWEKERENCYSGIVDGRYTVVEQQGDQLTFFDTSLEDFETLWRQYFDLDRDYGQVKATLCRHPSLAKAVEFVPGMRVLRQQPWEAICSFILSQNNNIKRIRGLVLRLCENFGSPVAGGYAFPTPDQIAQLELEQLQPVRSGFRAKYILDAAQKVASGQLDLAPLYSMPLAEARSQLRTIHGVGPKVAECALLYGFARSECVPVDVWIGRAMEALLPDGMPQDVLPVAGLAQQYLFHYVRICPHALDPSQPLPVG